MNNIYHSDIYQFDNPVSSYWEDISSENLQIDRLKKDTNSEIVVIGGGYTGLLCAINLIENHNLDVILVEAGKIGWGASSRNAGFNCLPPSKMSFKKMQSIYGMEETKKFFRNSGVFHRFEGIEDIKKSLEFFTLKNPDTPCA